MYNSKAIKYLLLNSRLHEMLMQSSFVKELAEIDMQSSFCLQCFRTSDLLMINSHVLGAQLDNSDSLLLRLSWLCMEISDCH